MGLPTGEIEVAAIARLRGDTTLQGLLVGASSPTWNVFDAHGVPTNQAFPYLVVQEITTQSGSALAIGPTAQDATDVFVQISAYTQAAGFKQARGIAKQVYSLFHRQSLVLTGGFTNFFLLFENAQEVPQSDGLTQGLIQRFKLMIQG